MITCILLLYHFYGYVVIAICRQKEYEKILKFGLWFWVEWSIIPRSASFGYHVTLCMVSCSFKSLSWRKLCDGGGVIFWCFIFAKLIVCLCSICISYDFLTVAISSRLRTPFDVKPLWLFLNPTVYDCSL